MDEIDFKFLIGRTIKSVTVCEHFGQKDETVQLGLEFTDGETVVLTSTGYDSDGIEITKTNQLFPYYDWVTYGKTILDTD